MQNGIIVILYGGGVARGRLQLHRVSRVTGGLVAGGVGWRCGCGSWPPVVRVGHAQAQALAQVGDGGRVAVAMAGGADECSDGGSRPVQLHGAGSDDVQ